MMEQLVGLYYFTNLQWDYCSMQQAWVFETLTFLAAVLEQSHLEVKLVVVVKLSVITHDFLVK